MDQHSFDDEKTGSRIRQNPAAELGCFPHLDEIAPRQVVADGCSFITMGSFFTVYRRIR
jgi:hypothetical protein